MRLKGDIYWLIQNLHGLALSLTGEASSLSYRRQKQKQDSLYPMRRHLSQGLDPYGVDLANRFTKKNPCLTINTHSIILNTNQSSYIFPQNYFDVTRCIYPEALMGKTQPAFSLLYCR